MKDVVVQLYSVPADFGEGANDGAYYPVGLLTIASYLRRNRKRIDVQVVDLHHEHRPVPEAHVVGISTTSTLNYRGVLRLAAQAKEADATVVLGGPHATQLAEQILRNRSDIVDYVIRGNGEVPFAGLLDVLRQGDLHEIPSLSWKDRSGSVVHNPGWQQTWRYDDFAPLDLSVLRCGIECYWAAFQRRIDDTVDAAFLVFTHFGCGYREMMMRRPSSPKQLAKWCSYCSLNDPSSKRTGSAIVRETLHLIDAHRLPPGSKILLKCYGDNVATQPEMLADLSREIERTVEWRDYNIGWTFYAQSSRLTEDLVRLLVRVGTWNLYIGFDSADNRVQLLNGLGTSVSSHRKAVRLCRENGIRVQAGFVLGCAGETPQSVDKTLAFARELAGEGVLERINSAVLFIIPGSPAYKLLVHREPWIGDLDLLPTEELQLRWIRHFCPDLAATPEEGLELLRRAANELDTLSPGPHASMGFESDRLKVHRRQKVADGTSTL